MVLTFWHRRHTTSAWSVSMSVISFFLYAENVVFLHPVLKRAFGAAETFHHLSVWIHRRRYRCCQWDDGWGSDFSPNPYLFFSSHYFYLSSLDQCLSSSHARTYTHRVWAVEGWASLKSCVCVCVSPVVWAIKVSIYWFLCGRVLPLTHHSSLPLSHTHLLAIWITVWPTCRATLTFNTGNPQSAATQEETDWQSDFKDRNFWIHFHSGAKSRFFWDKQQLLIPQNDVSLYLLLYLR